MSRIRTGNKRRRRKLHTTPHYRSTDQKWFWTWEREYPGEVCVPFRGYRYYGRSS